MSDYDGVLLNLTSLAKQAEAIVFNVIDLGRVFDPRSWADIIACRGDVLIVGDPCFPGLTVRDPEVEARRQRLAGEIRRTEPTARSSVAAQPEAMPTVARINPLCAILAVQKDDRPFDYRRVNQGERGSFTGTFYKYLDSALDWTYSLSSVGLADGFRDALVGRATADWRQTWFGTTKYKTALIVRLQFVHREGHNIGSLTLLPPSAGDTGREDAFMLREFFGIATSLPAPEWAEKLKVPGQSEVEARIAGKLDALAKMQQELTSEVAGLERHKRWLRLLYDDGDTLEAIAKESLESLGAVVAKMSKEKDDYRVRVAGYPEGVMEVKGTQKPRFPVGGLRQLAHWMDDVTFTENIVIKGIFLGNSGRNEEPQKRGKLFEPNSEDFACKKDMAVLRTMDLFCVVVLNQLGRLDKTAFWNSFFGCKGSFDAGTYWGKLSKEFQISSGDRPKPLPG
jgi:hypothetical protein